MAERIKYPIPWDLGRVFKARLDPAWQAKWNQRTKPANKNPRDVDEAWQNTGGSTWCDANKTVKEFWEEQASEEEIRRILETISQYNGSVGQRSELRVDHQATDHETFREPVRDLLRGCIAAGKLTLRVPRSRDLLGRTVLADANLELARDGEYSNSRLTLEQDPLAGWSITEAEPARVVYNLTNGHPDLYKLVLRLFYPFYGISLSHPLARLWEPWATQFPRIHPIVKPVAGQPERLYFWGWRSDGRAPADIFHDGFLPKLEVRNDLHLWNTLTEVYAQIKDNLDTAIDARPRPPQDPAPAHSDNRVWFRYRQQDLCLNASIAVATCFAGAVVFPKVPPHQPHHVKPLRRGQGNAVHEHPKEVYVYAIRKPRDRVHDIGHVQELVHRERSWAEVAMSRVEGNEILFALKVQRWPENADSGWFRVLEVCRRNDDGSCGAWLDINTRETRVNLGRDWPQLWACLQHYLLPLGPPQDDFRYQWTLRCGRVFAGDDEVGCAGAGGTAHATDLSPLPPEVPLNLQATPNNGQVQLNWGAVATATGYTIKRSTTQGSGYVQIGTNAGSPAGAPSTSYTDTPPGRGIRYYYVIVASNSGGDSANSNEVNVMLPPLAPTRLRSNPLRKRVVLSWTASNGARSYTVKRKAGGGPYADVVNGVTNISYTDEQLANGTTYSYVVTAVNEGGESPVSNEVTATPRWWKFR